MIKGKHVDIKVGLIFTILILISGCFKATVCLQLTIEKTNLSLEGKFSDSATIQHLRPSSELKTKSVTGPSYSYPPFMVNNNTLFVNEIYESITVLDISELSNPKFISNTDFNIEDKDGRHLLLHENNLLFSIRSLKKDNSLYDFYFEVINTSALDSLVLEANVKLATDEPYYNRWRNPESFGFMQLEHHTFFFIGHTVIDCTDINNVMKIDYSFGSDFEADYNDYQRYVVKDNLMILPTKNETNAVGIVIYEFESFSPPVKIGEWFGEVNTSKSYMYLDEQRVYMGWTELEVFDISNVTKPEHLGFLNFTDSHRVNVFYNNHIISLYYENLTIYNATNVEDISILGRYQNEDPINYGYIVDHLFDRNKVTDDRLYCSFGGSEFEDKVLIIFNWSDPTNITVLAMLGTTSYISKNMSAIGYLEFLLFNVAIIITITVIIGKRKKGKERYE
ncbi:MAG: hypothetical protein HZR80_15170 [Candidatus Heimdallarchaeota archaeon]